MESRIAWRIIAVVLILGLVIGLFYLLRTVLTPIFIALLLAYLLDLLIDRFERIKFNRTVAILILAIVVIGVIATVGGFLIFQAQQELVAFYKNLPGYIERMQESVFPYIEEHFNVRLPHTWDEILAEAESQIAHIDPAALKPVTTILGKITSSTIALISWIVGLLIIPVFLFYFLRDWDLITERMGGLVPPAYRDYIFDKARKIDGIVGVFIRGQLTVALILGILYSAGLLIVGIDLAVVIGMGAGIAFIVPYLGTILGIVAATVMALLEFGFAWQLLGAWGVFAVVQFFEGYFLTPRIMGNKVGLSPVAVIFALLVGVSLFGLVGMLVAVPVAAVLNVFIGEALEKYKASDLMKEASEEIQ